MWEENEISPHNNTKRLDKNHIRRKENEKEK